MKKTSLLLVSFLLVSSTAYAIAPAVLWIGRTVATFTAETIAIEAVSRGFAANDPYVKNRVTIPSKNIPAAFRKTKGFLNPYWAAFALAAGLLLDEDGFKQITPTAQHLYKLNGCPEIFVGGIYKDDLFCGNTGLPAGAVIDSVTIYEGDLSSGVVQCSFGSYGQLPCFTVIPVDYAITYTGSDGEVTHRTRTTYADRTTIPVELGETQKRLTDAEVEQKALAYLASDNRPDAAFMNTAGEPIPELMENAVIVPVPNVDANTLADLAAYRAGQLQTTDPTADHYVTPERLEEIKKLAAQEDAANTPEGKLDELNEKMKQPITQAQYEETNKKYSDGIDAVTASLGSSGDSDYSDMDEHFTKLDGIITDLPNTSLPAPADISVPQYVDCQQIHLSDGNGHELDFPSPSQCAKIETFKQGFGYFLAVSVVFLLGMQLLTRPHG